MVSALLNAIAALAIGALNAVIAGVGAALALAIAVLPDMPALPEWPTPLVTAASWVAWVFPIGTLLDVLAFVLSMWLLWQAVAIALRWAKALGD